MPNQIPYVVDGFKSPFPLSNPITREALIPTASHGQRVDVVLAQLFPDFSRATLQNWLKEKSITIDNGSRRPKDKVFGGEHVQLRVILEPKDIASQPEDIPLSIMFEDETLLLVNKSAGLVVHPGAGNQTHTLMNALLHHAPSLQHLPRAGIIHRLDKDTTGLLIVAKTLPAYTHLIQQMQARDIVRHYLTLVQGHLISGGLIQTAYGRHPRDRIKMAVCQQGREAITEYRIHKHYQFVTLLDVTLQTGRTHQIRVHLAHIDHPVIGDPLYGKPIRVKATMPDTVRSAIQNMHRQALHAATLSLTHPISGERLTIKAPLPDDFQSLLTSIEHAHA